ncbi:hypothetical protein CGCF413_v002440 [Colletotrichum fructicola]|nr:hypothetical protein CGCF413_v002440 [Colletotrichum fructicola]
MAAASSRPLRCPIPAANPRDRMSPVAALSSLSPSLGLGAWCGASSAFRSSEQWAMPRPDRLPLPLPALSTNPPRKCLTMGMAATRPATIPRPSNPACPRQGC